jgi:hypothetical protein
LGCSEKTVFNGIEELALLPDEPEYEAAIRESGGGRKGYAEQHPNIDEQFLNVLKDIRLATQWMKKWSGLI